MNIVCVKEMGETVLLGVVPDQLGHFLVETDGRVILVHSSYTLLTDALKL